MDVGATRITLSNGASVDLSLDDMPRDLLNRVADNRAYVSVNSREVELKAPQDIYAATVLETLREQEVDTDVGVGLAVPGWWSPVVLERVQEAFQTRGVEVSLVNEAEAAVVDYRQNQHAGAATLPESIAVLNLRAEASSVVIVDDCHREPTALVSPRLIHQEGGSHLDRAVLHHLVAGLDGLEYSVDVTDPTTIDSAKVALLQCRSVRESLSTRVVESIQPDLPGSELKIRFVRSELEEVAQPWIKELLRMVRTAVEQSGLPVTTVMLTGGLANMPLISQRLSAELGLEVIIPESPDLVGSRGAEIALAARENSGVPRWLRIWRRMVSRTRAIAYGERPEEQKLQRRLKSEPVEVKLDPDAFFISELDASSSLETSLPTVKIWDFENTSGERLISADDR